LLCGTCRKTTELGPATANFKTHAIDGAAKAFHKLISALSQSRARGLAANLIRLSNLFWVTRRLNLH
jgi:hypothetical protein